MSSLTETLLSQVPFSRLTMDRVVSEFSPSDIRQTIADLVARDQLALANALSDAGISLYPDSQDILAISALLAEIQKDWGNAEQWLTRLVELQAQSTPPSTWRHLIRVQRCHCEPGKALMSALQATAQHPQDRDLAQELADLQDLLGQQTVLSSPAFTQ